MRKPVRNCIHGTMPELPSSSDDVLCRLVSFAELLGVLKETVTSDSTPGPRELRHPRGELV